MSEIRFNIYDNDIEDYFPNLLSTLEVYFIIENDNNIIDTVLNRSLTDNTHPRRDSNRRINIISKKCENNDLFCSICSDSINPGQYMSVLSCNHTFHMKCIEEWGHYKPECPLCKTDIPVIKENKKINKDGMEQNQKFME